MNRLIEILTFLLISQPVLAFSLFSSDEEQKKNFSPPVIHNYEEIKLHDLSKKEIILIQKRLRRDRFYTGRVDGSLGRQTRRALRRFQKENHIYTDKTLTVHTLQVLNIDDGYASLAN